MKKLLLITFLLSLIIWSVTTTYLIFIDLQDEFIFDLAYCSALTALISGSIGVVWMINSVPNYEEEEVNWLNEDVWKDDNNYYPDRD